MSRASNSPMVVVAQGRLSMFTSHLLSPTETIDHTPALRPRCLSAQGGISPSSPPPPGNLKGLLTIVDERTGKRYQVEASQEGTVRATDLKKGLKLYSSGYLNTAPARSATCYVDGEKGILRYRGYPIEELAEKSTFMEVAYLIMYGNLPSERQLADWEFAFSQHSAVPQGVLDIIQSMPHDAHPMAVLVSAISALSAFHPDANPALRGLDIYLPKQVRDKQIVRVIGKMPTIAAAIYLRMAGRPPVLPSSHLSYTENFLYMLDSLGNRSYKPNPKLAWVLDIIFILHAEHEMNCSSATVRHLASTVLKMLSEIETVGNIPGFISEVKARKRKLIGFGHRLYKIYDPRAKIIKQLTEEAFSVVGPDPLVEVAVALENAALSDEFFIKRRLYPNADFYSGLIFRAMGFPPEYFTVVFAIARMAGFLAHWRESLDDPDTKIMRPQQVYIGEWWRHYTSINGRTVSSNADRLGQVTTSNASRRRLAGSCL